MTTIVPWLLMVSWLTWQHGFKQNKMPEPYHYLGATAAISIAALVGMANKTIGALLAYGLVIALFLQTPSIPEKTEKSPVKDKAGSASSGGSNTVPTPQPGPAPVQPRMA